MPDILMRDPKAYDPNNPFGDDPAGFEQLMRFKPVKIEGRVPAKKRDMTNFQDRVEALREIATGQPSLSSDTYRPAGQTPATAPIDQSIFPVPPGTLPKKTKSPEANNPPIPKGSLPGKSVYSGDEVEVETETDAPPPSPLADSSYHRDEVEGIQGSEGIGGEIAAYLTLPANEKFDLSPLLAYVDSQTGSNLLKGYNRPKTAEEIQKERHTILAKIYDTQERAKAARLKMANDLAIADIKGPYILDAARQKAQTVDATNAANADLRDKTLKAAAALQAAKLKAQADIEAAKLAAKKDKPGKKTPEKALTDKEIDSLAGDAHLARTGNVYNPENAISQKAYAKFKADIRAAANKATAEGTSPRTAVQSVIDSYTADRTADLSKPKKPKPAEKTPIADWLYKKLKK